ncbi:Abi family protein [Lactiplantibacillus plantarum]|nr:Abi family protein [Lactiplantibacillus plantarum]
MIVLSSFSREVFFILTTEKRETILLTQSHIFDKPFVDFDFQIKRLKDRGLNIINADIPQITSIIRQHGYYQIINGYGALFEETNTQHKHYVAGTTFEDIYVQFNIDRQLGQLLLTYLLNIEEHFANILSYSTAKHFDVNNFYKDDSKNPDSNVPSYLDYHHFSNQPIQVLKDLHDLSLECNAAPTKWYIENKNHVPSWILFMNAELGTLNRYYKICPTSIKKEVADELLPPVYSLNNIQNFSKGKKTSSWKNAANSSRGKIMYKGLEIMREFRNCIAHNSRILAYKSNTNLPTDFRNILLIESAKLYTNQEYYNGTGKNDLFALFMWILICQPSIDDRLLFLDNIHEFFYGSNINTNTMNVFIQGTKLPSNFFSRLKTLSNSL